MNGSRTALAVAGVALVVGMVAYVARPVGHIPPYDANLVRLAESDLQGYCAGETLWKTGGAEDARMTGECRARLRGTRSDEPRMASVIPSFCRAIVDMGWTEGSVSDCADIMVSNQFWPTYDGGLTNAWNRARPYPRAAIVPAAKKDGSRTGEHEGQERPTGDPRGLE